MLRMLRPRLSLVRSSIQPALRNPNGNNAPPTIIAELVRAKRTMADLASATYTPAEESVIKWSLSQASILSDASAPADKKSAVLDELNKFLSPRTTLLGKTPSKADIAVYEAVAPLVRAWTPEQRTGATGRPNIVRHLDFVQNSPVFGLEGRADKVAIDPEEVLYRKPPVDAKAEKERLKKEKAAAIATGNVPEGAAAKQDGQKTMVDRTKETAAKVADKVADKAAEVKEKGAAAVAGYKQQKEKKEKKPKQPAAPAAPAVLSPSLIDLRVGHVLKAIKHPEADSLYVSTIAMGDPAGAEDTSEYEGQVVRTVCSGLNGLVPLEEMQGRKIVCVCNLKPVKMRGIKSAAMVLAASPRLKEGEEDNHKGPVELVSPPEGAKAGERVFFEGFKDGEPEKVLNPKKKIWETFQPGFTTTDKLEVAFDAVAVKELEGKVGLGKLVTESGGVCTVKSLKGATVR